MTATDIDVRVLRFMDASEQLTPLGIRARMSGIVPKLAEIDASLARLSFAGLVTQSLNGFRLSETGLAALTLRVAP